MNKFDKGMDDYYLGKEEPLGDPGLEYLRGWGYAESLYEEQPEQVDDREQPYKICCDDYYIGENPAVLRKALIKIYPQYHLIKITKI